MLQDMASIRASNNYRILVSAREAVNLSIHQAAIAIGISDENLKLAELGERPLTLAQLRLASEAYQVPIGYFYLKEFPDANKPIPIPDLRLEPGNVGVEHHRLNLEIKKCRDRRELFLELAKDLEEPIIEFKTLAGNDFSAMAIKIRDRLGVKEVDLSRLGYDDVYGYWKEKIEDDGVLVYESQYLPDVTGVIGAAIFYEECPIILVKRGGDANERKLFTLLHEYAHLLFGKSAINDIASQSAGYLGNSESKLEADCNNLAAEILVPSYKVVRAQFTNLAPKEMMEALAQEFRVTYSTAAVCLKRLGLIAGNELSELLEARKSAAADKKLLKSGDVKIPREHIMRQDMGRPTFKLVLNAYASGLLDIFDASSILNLRVKKIDRLIGGLR